MRPTAAWRQWSRRWLFKGLDDRAGVVELRYRRIYILPTRAGLLFALLLTVMWLGAVNYGNSLLFLLVFLLAGLALVAILHTFLNLLGLRLTPLPPAPVFAGETAVFPLLVENPSRRARLAVGIAHDGEQQDAVDLASAAMGRLAFRLPTSRRGWRESERVAIQTNFPTGLFRAWTWLDLRQKCLVYPHPEQGPVPLPASGGEGSAGARQGDGDEDFQELRRYRPGDSLRHVAWRVVARGGEPQTKRFAGGGAQARLWLDWHALPHLEPEARLSRLCRWVLDAEASGLRYGLRLPGVEIAPDHGAHHRHHCLKALALFPT